MRYCNRTVDLQVGCNVADVILNWTSYSLRRKTACGEWPFSWAGITDKQCLLKTFPERISLQFRIYSSVGTSNVGRSHAEYSTCDLRPLPRIWRTRQSYLIVIKMQQGAQRICDLLNRYIFFSLHTRSLLWYCQSIAQTRTKQHEYADPAEMRLISYSGYGFSQKLLLSS